MVVKEAHARLLITHAAASEHGADARHCLPHGKDLGLQVTVACSDDSHSCPAALTAVGPQARWPAEHFPTVKPIWGHLKKALVSSRRKGKASGEEHNEERLLALAQQ